MLLQIKDDPCLSSIDDHGYMSSISRNVEAVTDGFHNFLYPLKVFRFGIETPLDKDDEVNRVCLENNNKGALIMIVHSCISGMQCIIIIMIIIIMITMIIKYYTEKKLFQFVLKILTLQ